MAADINGDNLIVTLDAPVANVLSIDVAVDLYTVWKDWLLDENKNLGYPSLFRPVGGDDLTPGIQSGAYFFWRNDFGWRLRSSEDDQTIFVNGNLAPQDSTLPITIPTIGGFTVMYDGLQPITQNIDTIKDTLEFTTFNGGIYWDSANGKTSITLSTDGNERVPLKNLSDVKTQAAAKGFSRIYVVTDGVIGATEDVNNFTLVGETASRTSVTFIAGCITVDAEFEFLTLSGTLDGSITANRCSIGTLSNLGGTVSESVLKECIFLAQTITFKTANTQRIHMIDCSSSGPATTVDTNDHAGELHCHNFKGVIIFTNHTGAGLAAFDTIGGRITLDVSITGTFLLAGVGTVIDNTTSANIINQMLETVNIKNNTAKISLLLAKALSHD